MSSKCEYNYGLLLNSSNLLFILCLMSTCCNTFLRLALLFKIQATDAIYYLLLTIFIKIFWKVKSVQITNRFILAYRHFRVRITERYGILSLCIALILVLLSLFMRDPQCRRQPNPRRPRVRLEHRQLHDVSIRSLSTVHPL